MPLLRLLIRLLPWILVITAVIFIWRSFKDFFGDKKEEPAVSVNYNTILTSVEELGKMELVRYNFKDALKGLEQ